MQQYLIHPTAVIEPGAGLGENVRVGAYAYIGAEVTLGAGTVVHHHATVEGFTTLGENNEVFPYACIGGKTHDLKYIGGKTGLIVGDRNVFREYVTVHCATKDGEFTHVGNGNTILAYSHIAHDCIVGNRLIMSSHAALGGHVIVHDHVNIGWGVGVHQFCRIGSHAMVGGMTRVAQDVPPLMIAVGNPSEVRTINKVGLERAGYTEEDMRVAKLILKILYRDELPRAQAMALLQKHAVETPHKFFDWVCEFVHNSERGLSS